ncbi:hypothetical protein MYMA111404_02035 [Mycoplasma marinum]|uniref:Uncharacterized protein n=1 Tax=Mycoplasma marinum TaxID=1937190 RepID=A0A4R0XR68_9MOLU|nr:hypothetical protein [Mycoplasma marinum]TCG11375.1 hypothetical protein C4B24_02380 [Mycoplasma marinum]
MNKVYLKYYFSSLFKNKMGITIFILLSASGLALNSIIGSGEEINYTLVFILPSICWIVLSTLLFAIELYGKTKTNGMELMFAGMPISRGNVLNFV